MKKRIFLAFGAIICFVNMWIISSCTSSGNSQGTVNENVPGTVQRKAGTQNKALAKSFVFSESPKAINSAELCGDCHRPTFQTWRASSHAHAMDNQVFQDVLHLAVDSLGATVRGTCFSCHAPMASETGDFNLQQKVSWEGVTCDYCHSIREVSMAGPNPVAELKFSLIKGGPWEETYPRAHGSIFSEVYTSSRLCATCHEYQNALGFPVLSTYSEWKESRYAKEGLQC